LDAFEKIIEEDLARELNRELEEKDLLGYWNI